MHAVLTRSAEIDIGYAPVQNHDGEIIGYSPRVDDVTFADRFATADEAIAAATAMADYDS